MSENKWCEEPWPTFKETGEEKFVDLNQHNYDRAVACVNALSGVSDPAAFVARAREVERALRVVTGNAEKKYGTWVVSSHALDVADKALALPTSPTGGDQ